MRCQRCGDREAVVHLTQIVENQVTTMHLCEPCAAEKGIESVGAGVKPLHTEFLGTLGKGVGAGLPGMEDAPHAVCATCGLTMQELRDLGRLGCVDCYKAFEGPLRELLRRLHGSTMHVGERYVPPDAAETPAEQQAEDLRDRLRQAIDDENFELAAELRDLLRTVE